LRQETFTKTLLSQTSLLLIGAVMKRTALALTIIFALTVSLLSSMPVIDLASANFWPTPTLFIESPYNKTYRNDSIPFKVEVHVSTGAPAVVSISYSLDGGANVTFTNLGYTTWFPSPLPNNHDIYSIKENIDNLSDGNHTLKVYTLDSKGGVMSNAVTFTVDRNFRVPAILIVSPLNQSYSKNEVPLTYIIDAQTTQIKWAVYYLDSYESDSYRQHTFNGNITLSKIPEGSHSIKLEVLTESGLSTQVTYFNIDTTQTDNFLDFENPLTSLTIVAIGITLVMVLAIILYKRKKSEATN
jgi:hypothetical protein